jgi:hypothetical protein
MIINLLNYAYEIFFIVSIFIIIFLIFFPSKNIKKLLFEDEKILLSNLAGKFISPESIFHAFGKLYLTNARIIYIPNFGSYIKLLRLKLYVSINLRNISNLTISRIIKTQEYFLFIESQNNVHKFVIYDKNKRMVTNNWKHEIKKEINQQEKI